MKELEEIKSELIKIGGALSKKFGDESYPERSRLNDAINKLQSLSESHKRDVMEAYQQGAIDSFDESKEDYYAKTFGK